MIYCNASRAGVVLSANPIPDAVLWALPTPNGICEETLISSIDTRKPDKDLKAIVKDELAIYWEADRQGLTLDRPTEKDGFSASTNAVSDALARGEGDGYVLDCKGAFDASMMVEASLVIVGQRVVSRLAGSIRDNHFSKPARGLGRYTLFSDLYDAATLDGIHCAVTIGLDASERAEVEKVFDDCPVIHCPAPKAVKPRAA
ncbi:hypothetical protein [Roseibium alexandrii]|uniref:Uncharacterized protein n=1 Tax=Roseibium alexandrii (strain DSM 17067 / NCIMB 14079 / DFL-11) TaxID=244592 RepID=A0A5E8H371_ROSAD|nr:hypothetical protein [Roseibium alexandrii]EEE46990.1 hypothetical protein SADFL11_4279 [Roseibium alexandrii DFL-11]